MEYDLNLVGLRLGLRTPFPITISENLRPFLCSSHREYDCVVTLQSEDPLPLPAEGGIWHGSEYYDVHQGHRRVFHCQGKTPFAVTRFLENGNVEISVLPNYLSYFTGSEGIFNRIGMETLLLQNQGLLLHASLIDHKGKAIAFAGPSGVGKSTQAVLWELHTGAKILNGDRAALRSTSGGWWAYGSPRAGTSGIYKNEAAPLAAIVLLEKGSENTLTKLTPDQAFARLFPEFSIHRWDKDFTARAMDLILQALDAVPVFALKCRPDKAAVLLVKEGLGL